MFPSLQAKAGPFEKLDSMLSPLASEDYKKRQAGSIALKNWLLKEFEDSSLVELNKTLENLEKHSLMVGKDRDPEVVMRVKSVFVAIFKVNVFYHLYLEKDFSFVSNPMSYRKIPLMPMEIKRYFVKVYQLEDRTLQKKAIRDYFKRWPAFESDEYLILRNALRDEDILDLTGFVIEKQLRTIGAHLPQYFCINLKLLTLNLDEEDSKSLLPYLKQYILEYGKIEEIFDDENWLFEAAELIRLQTSDEANKLRASLGTQLELNPFLREYLLRAKALEPSP